MSCNTCNACTACAVCDGDYEYDDFDDDFDDEEEEEEDPEEEELCGIANDDEDQEWIHDVQAGWDEETQRWRDVNGKFITYGDFIESHKN